MPTLVAALRAHDATLKQLPIDDAEEAAQSAMNAATRFQQDAGRRPLHARDWSSTGQRRSAVP
jgi:hypothetical protein